MNPFTRLKHYRTDLSLKEARENHATESLAAMLHFSPDIKIRFIDFLFGKEVADCADDLVVQTQADAGEAGFPDLFISDDALSHYAVEFKVGSRESEQQLRKYSNWLSHKSGTHLLGSIVKNPNPHFPFKECGANVRKTWGALANAIQTWLPTLGVTDKNLAMAFLDYMNTESIAINWKPAESLGYGVGISAMKAVKGVFEAVAMHPKLEGCETKIVISKNSESWPRLDVAKSNWAKSLGGNVTKAVWLWFTVPGIWEAEEHCFYPEIQLWCGSGDWAKEKDRMPLWAKQLTQHKYQGAIQGSGWPNFDPNFTACQKPPGRVYFWKESTGICEDKLKSMEGEALVEKLADILGGECDRVDNFLGLLKP